MDSTIRTTARLRTGVVSAYVGGGDVALVRRARSLAGRVTVSGKAGLKTLTALADEDDAHDVDFDPAGYAQRDEPQLALFERDWTSRQRDLGLSVIRSAGCYVPKGDEQSLKRAMTEPVGDGVVRVLSLHESWLRRGARPVLLDAIRNCDDHLAFVFASVMDPFGSRDAVDGVRELLTASRVDDRRVELLRTDTAGIAFAAHGGSLGSVGLGTSLRHHGLPLSREQMERYRHRQRWPLVFVDELLSWHRGNVLGALSDFGGAGLTECSCLPCGGRSLLRFDTSHPGRVPADVRADVVMHDLTTWSAAARRILRSDDPPAAWSAATAIAQRKVAEIATRYRVALALPPSLTAWR